MKLRSATGLTHSSLPWGYRIASCLDAADYKEFSAVTLYGCHLQGGNQEWEYLSSLRFKHRPSNLCMQSHKGEDGVCGADVIDASALTDHVMQVYHLVINTCSEAIPEQEWVFQQHGSP